MSQKAREYEVVLVLGQSEDLDQAKTDVQDNLKKRNADVINADDLGMRKLFHPIKNIEQGFFQLLRIKAEPTAISQINSDFRVNQSVLKSLISRVG